MPDVEIWSRRYPMLAREVAPCRRCGRLRRRRHARGRERCRRGDRDRLAAAAACDRRHRRAEAGAPQVWPDRPGNLAFEVAFGDAAATKDAFAKAAHVVELKLVNQRLVTNYLDTRGVVAEYDGDRYTLTLGSQGSHVIRDIIGGDVLKLPPEKMRVITPDVGGGFGTKLFPYREYALAAVAAKRLASR